VRLHDPLWLLALVPLLAVAAWNARHRFSVLYSSVRGLGELPVTVAQRFKRLLPIFELAGLALIVVALARPQQGLEEFKVHTEGIDIVVCLDRSGSMRAEDFFEKEVRVNRLHIVKRVVKDFIEGRPDDRIGLVAFGGFAESRCPLTLDHDALLDVLDEVKIPEPLRDARGRVVDEQSYREELATAIGDALAIGAARLEESDARSRVMILVSDGESNTGVVEPLEAAQAAETLGIKVYTVGVGSTGLVPVPYEDPFGRKRYANEMFRLDEATLKAIADTTGGKYFNARDTDALESVYEQIDRLEKTRTEGVLYTQYRELYAAVLLPGVGLFLLAWILRMTRFLTLP
jgi:Ca-activated chloride channel family protein